MRIFLLILHLAIARSADARDRIVRSIILLGNAREAFGRRPACWNLFARISSSTTQPSFYGGGFYVIPFNSMMLSLVAGISEEDRLLNLSLGTKLNMVFQGQ